MKSYTGSSYFLAIGVSVSAQTQMILATSVLHCIPFYCFSGSTTRSDGYRYHFNGWWVSKTPMCTSGESHAISGIPKAMNDDWLTHFTQDEGEGVQKPNFPVFCHIAEQRTGCAPRVDPSDVLQADARPFPQLILPENNTTLLAEPQRANY